MSSQRHSHLLRTHISVLDLLLCEDSRAILMRDDKEEILSLLYNIGFKKECVRYKVGVHRPLFSNKVVDCGYFESYERTDDEWMSLPYCSIANTISSYLIEDRGMYNKLTKLYDSLVFTTLFTLAEPEDFTKKEGE